MNRKPVIHLFNKKRPSLPPQNVEATYCEGEERRREDGACSVAHVNKDPNKEEAAHGRPLHRHAAGQMSSRPPFTPEPQNGTVKAYSRIALLVKLPQGAASRILLTVAIMSRQRRVPVARLKEL